MKRKWKLLQKRIAVILKDDNKKGFFTIFKEALVFWIVKKEFPNFYFGKFLYRKGIKNYTDYLSSNEVDTITLSKKLHKPQYASLLRNKLAFALYMDKNSMPVPPMVSYNLGNRFFFHSKVQIVSNNDQLKVYFTELFKNTGKTKVFVKAITEMGGVGAYLLSQENLEEQIKNHGAYILKNDCIHQEVIVQHDRINALYPDSVNTIRFDTYMDKNNEIHILSGYMRFGRGGSVLDNSSSGGFWVSINLKKGTLTDKSYQLMKYGGERLDRHPDTGTVFDEYQIPYFEEACDLIQKCVTLIPDKIIGWDIAITATGPVIIEGNDNNSLLGPDIAYGGFCKHPLYAQIIEEA